MKTPFTSSHARSLWREHPHRYDVPALVFVSLAALLYGVWLPVVTFDTLTSTETYSIISGIMSFVRAGDVLIALLLFSFSVVFPAMKLLLLLFIWFRGMAKTPRDKTVKWLRLLGKWSMLDTFVIAVLVGALQLGILAQTIVHQGIYIYFGAIILSLICTFMVDWMSRNRSSRITRLQAVRPLRIGSLWATILSLGLFAAGLVLPLMEIEKAIFWDNEFSLLDGLMHMAVQGHYLLTIAVFLFVVVTPAARFVTLLLFRLRRHPLRFPSPWLAMIDRWSMLDVFVLALTVVIVKVGGMAKVEFRPGLWCLLGAALLSLYDSWALHRSRLVE